MKGNRVLKNGVDLGMDELVKILAMIEKRIIKQ